MLDTKSASDKTTNNTAYYKAEIVRTFAEIRRVAEETDKSQAETDRLRRETLVILDRLKAMFNVACNCKRIEGGAPFA